MANRCMQRIAGVVFVVMVVGACGGCDDGSAEGAREDGGRTSGDAGRRRDDGTLADAGRDSGERTGLDAGDASGGRPTLADCDAIEADLHALIDANRACASDSDCMLVDTECTLIYTRDHCSGAFYVNAGIDADRFGQLDAELTACHYAQERPDTTDHCGGCTEEPCVPVCLDGICGAAAGAMCYGDEDGGV